MMELAQSQPAPELSDDFSNASVERNKKKVTAPRITLRLSDDELARLKKPPKVFR